MTKTKMETHALSSEHLSFRQSNRIKALTFLLLCTMLINGVLLWNSRSKFWHGYGDFASFYTAGTLVRRGLSSELYHPSAQWKVQQELFFGVEIRKGPLPYIRPPFEALLFSLFARWDYPTALAVWTILKLVLLAAIPFIVVWKTRWARPPPLWAIGLLSLGTYPGLIDTLMGQDAPVLAFLFALAFRQLEADREATAGFIFGVALFKFQLVIPVILVLLIAGRKRVVSGFALSGMVVLLVSAMMVGWTEILEYPRYLLMLNRTVGSGFITAENQINLRGFLVLFVGRTQYPGPIHWLLVPVALALLLWAGVLWKNAGKNFLAEGFGLATIVAIATSYYAYEYDLLLLLVPFLAIWSRRPKMTADRLSDRLEITGLVALLMMPLFWYLRVKLKAQFLMTIPLLAIGVAWGRKLHAARGKDRIGERPSYEKSDARTGSLQRHGS